MHLCLNCLGLGRCVKRTTMIVSEGELSNPKFLIDVRASARRGNVSSHRWLEYLYDIYCGYDGAIIDSEQCEIFLNLEVFEVPYIREWFRDWLCNSGPVRLRQESKERVRVLATVLRASFPAEASVWGIVPANDN